MKKIIIFLAFVMSIFTVFATGESFYLSDNNVLENGIALSSGNITITVYNASSGGTLLYNETFTNAITNGTYSVLVGNDGSLNLTQNTAYYYDMSINGQDIDFSGSERKSFVASIGDIADSSLSANVCLLDGGQTFSSGITVPTLNTGQGDNELYAMNQNVRTSDSPTFSGFTSTANSVIQGDNKYLIIKNSTNNELASFGSSTTTGGGIALRDVTGSVTTSIRGGSNSYFNGGNVGIGTTSPGAKLHVGGVGNDDIIRLDDHGYIAGFNGDIILRPIFANKKFYLKNSSNDGINSMFSFDGSDSYINALGGNVGIGTTSPSAKLDVDGNIEIGHNTGTSSQDSHGFDMKWSPSINYDGIHYYNHWTNGNGGDLLNFSNANGIKTLIDNRGRVGILTDTLTEELNINGQAQISDLIVGESGNRINANGDTNLFLNSDGGGLYLNYDVTDPVILSNDITIRDLQGTYSGGSAYVCVYDAGTLYASETACP